MAHDVFISYSIKDRLLADALCHKLEEDNIRCWIAPRDISPGGSWAGEIADAIPESKVMILVFSSNANASKQVLREVELAITSNLTVIPMKIEDVMPTGGMSYYLSTTHWIDAIGNKFDKRINTLSKKVQVMLGIDIKPEIPQPNSVPLTKSKPVPPTESKPVPVKKAQRQKQTRKKFKWAWIYIPFIIIVVLIGGYFAINRWFPQYDFLSKAISTPTPTHWNIASESFLDRYPGNAGQDSGGSPLLKEIPLSTPEDFELEAGKEVYFDNKNLKNAIIKNLNATREKQITDNVIKIEDMFDLRYLALIFDENTVGDHFLYNLLEPGDLEYESIIYSSPSSLTSLNGLQYAKNLIALSIKGYPIEDLSALSTLNSLRILNLQTGLWFDPEAFSNLDNLNQLRLEGYINQETIHTCSGLGNLRSLNIGYYSYEGVSLNEFREGNGNPAADFTPLENLEFLCDLNINELMIEDISSLGNLTNLNNLSINNDIITDIAPIGNLTNLRSLSLYSNSISDVSPLVNLRLLKELNLELNPLKNAELLNSMKNNLRELWLDASVYKDGSDFYELKYEGCVVYARSKSPDEYGFNAEEIVNINNDELYQGIRDCLSAIEKESADDITIADIFNLEVLIIVHHGEEFDENVLNCCNKYLNRYEIIHTDQNFDLDFLNFAKNLKVLYIRDYEISDISIVESLDSLELIVFNDNNISDLSPLMNLNSLKAAEFANNQIEDISPLVDRITTLQSINLSDNLIADLSPFIYAQYTEIHEIWLWNNKITDISPLLSLETIHNIGIGENNISNLSPLLDLTELKMLSIDETQLSDNLTIINELKDRGCEIQIN